MKYPYRDIGWELEHCRPKNFDYWKYFQSFSDETLFSYQFIMEHKSTYHFWKFLIVRKMSNPNMVNLEFIRKWKKYLNRRDVVYQYFFTTDKFPIEICDIFSEVIKEDLIVNKNMRKFVLESIAKKAIFRDLDTLHRYMPYLDKKILFDRGILIRHVYLKLEKRDEV